MYAMLKKEFFQYTAYKFMFLMGIYDLFILPCNGMITGLQVIWGEHFCNNPKLYYFAGVIGSDGFYAVGIICIILAFDRFLEMSFPSLARYVFGGVKTYLWLCVPILYQIYVGFQLPHVFNIKIYAMNSDPYHKIPEMENNPKFHFAEFRIFHGLNNGLLIVFLVLFYGGLIIIAKIKTKVYNKPQISKVQRQMTTQALCVCGEMFLAPCLHIFMMFVEFPVFIEIAAHFSWICLHGDTPVIYYFLNKSLRKAVKKMFSPITKKFQRVTPFSTSFSTNNRVEAYKNSSNISVTKNSAAY
uniref:Uncharacterized protein n=1 Tax=Panagrolaimus davidi TaxID=227884 RepID=A0A914P3U1_9BILA